MIEGENTICATSSDEAHNLHDSFYNVIILSGWFNDLRARPPREFHVCEFAKRFRHSRFSPRSRRSDRHSATCYFERATTTRMTNCVFPRAPPEQPLKFLNALTNDILDYSARRSSNASLWPAGYIQSYTYLPTATTVLGLTRKLARKFPPNKFPACVAAISVSAVLTPGASDGRNFSETATIKWGSRINEEMH